MRAVDTRTQSSPSSLPPRYVHQVDTCWPRVRVESAELAPGAGGHLYAHAVVQLGGLRPADVRVELVRIGAGTGGGASAAERRMFSDQSYDNGAFVFETSVARTDASRADHWMIHVHPAEEVDEPQVEYHIPVGSA